MVRMSGKPELIMGNGGGRVTYHFLGSFKLILYLFQASRAIGLGGDLIECDFHPRYGYVVESVGNGLMTQFYALSCPQQDSSVPTGKEAVCNLRTRL